MTFVPEPTITPGEIPYHSQGVGSVYPHQDGKPHDKCCHDCAFTRDGEKYGIREDGGASARIDLHPSTKKRFEQGEPFHCIHQLSDGRHRHCAGWHAKYGRHLMSS